MTHETKTEARERMDDEEFSRHANTIDRWDSLEDHSALARMLKDHRRARASEASLTAALSALRAEHRRLKREFSRVENVSAVLGASHANLREQLAEVTKERDATRAEMSRWAQRHLDVVGERNEARAALAASEEKARGMATALRSVREELETGGHAESCARVVVVERAASLAMVKQSKGLIPRGQKFVAPDVPCDCDIAETLALIATALSPSPAPRVGAESEEPKR